MTSLLSACSVLYFLGVSPCMLGLIPTGLSACFVVMAAEIESGDEGRLALTSCVMVYVDFVVCGYDISALPLFLSIFDG